MEQLVCNEMTKAHVARSRPTSSPNCLHEGVARSLTRPQCQGTIWGRVPHRRGLVTRSSRPLDDAGSDLIDLDGSCVVAAIETAGADGRIVRFQPDSIRAGRGRLPSVGPERPGLVRLAREVAYRRRRRTHPETDPASGRSVGRHPKRSRRSDTPAVRRCAVSRRGPASRLGP